MGASNRRYRGGTAPDIWVGNLLDGTFKKITDWAGTDDFPMWYQDRVCFLSDRDGRENIYSCRRDGSDVQQHTHHSDFDVRWPDGRPPGAAACSSGRARG